MPDTPKNLEDLVRLFGPDKMQMFSEMVRPDQHEEREEDANLPTGPVSALGHTPEEERAIIQTLTQHFGRNPTQQEIHLALKQAAQF